jgi:hypothetical protein
VRGHSLVKCQCFHILLLYMTVNQIRKVITLLIIIKVFLQITTHSRLLSQANSRAIASAAGFKGSQSRCISLQEFHTEQQFIKTLE